MWAAPCPKKGTSGGSATVGKACKLVVVSKVPEDLQVHWVDFEGNEREGSPLYADSPEEHSSFEGHKFRFRTASSRTLVKEYVVPPCPNGRVSLEVPTCEGLIPPPEDGSWYDPSREAEFASLVLPTQCDESQPSPTWSCVRALTKEDVEGRVQGTYGFLPNETRGSIRKAYQVLDEGYVDHIPQIPHLTPQGFLLMQQTEAMRQVLGEFWAAHNTTSRVKVHEPIAGFYSNVHSVMMSKLDLDEFPDIRTKIVKEMQKVLEWWTRLRLRHTSTFGIRVYKGGSMLINHVDRHDTHLASAVIQVGQEAEKGWPLELLTPSGLPLEVYLQPGQMVLYEGARVFHGRPMRFVGKSFANIFSHFSPAGYGGLGSGRPYDYRFRTGDIQVGWPRQRVQGKGADTETCEDKPPQKKGEKKGKADQKGSWWWPF